MGADSVETRIAARQAWNRAVLRQEPKLTMCSVQAWTKTQELLALPQVVWPAEPP
jgi:hypothetical protein